MKEYSTVIVSTEVPKPEPTSAGERLIRELYLALEAKGQAPVFLAPVPRNGYAEHYDVDAHFIPVDTHPATRSLQKLLSPVNTWTPNLSFFFSIIADPKARSIIKNAQIVDLQWTSNVLLAPLVRLLNPTAYLIGTFHDVAEQRLRRRAREEHRSLKSAVWSAQAFASRRMDRMAIKSLDRAVVLSEKDRSLLRSFSAEFDKIIPVIPPVYLQPDSSVERNPNPYEILFVGTMYRWENHQAVEWFIKDILPHIWADKPEVRFTVVGESPSSDLLKVGDDSRITFTGFVDDVEPFYAKAGLVVAPIKLGSGVKFKTLDAILRAIPIITTSVGVEGVANVAWVSALAHTSESFAQKVVEVLSQYEKFARKAEQARHDALITYSQENYREIVGEVYGAK